MPGTPRTMEPRDEQPVDRPGDEKNVTPARGNNAARNAGAGAVGLALLVAKFKGLIVLLLQFKFLFVFAKVFALSWTFLLSLWLYVLFFGWRFAIVILLALAVHELGHYFAFRAYGLEARLPQFIPFLGAYTMGTPPDDLEHDAYIALAGPLTGLALAALCFGIGSFLKDPFWMAVADVSAFLNLFNLLPMVPFDGGRVIAAVWPPLWILGIAGFVIAAIAWHIPIIFVIVIGALGIPAIVAMWRGHVDPRAATLTVAARVRVSISYVGTALGLLFILSQAHVGTSGAVTPW
ncbi:MAG TPA: site-2 protease family protein [Candidatus Baltobacteraceae bacterium]